MLTKASKRVQWHCSRFAHDPWWANEDSITHVNHRSGQASMLKERANPRIDGTALIWACNGAAESLQGSVTHGVAGELRIILHKLPESHFRLAGIPVTGE